MEITEIQGINIPLVALRGLTVLPDMIIHFDLSRKPSIEAVKKALEMDQLVFLVAQRNAAVENPDREGLYDVGTVAKVKQITKLPNGIDRVLVEGLYRAQIIDTESIDDGKFYKANVIKIDDEESTLEEAELEALKRTLSDVFFTYIKFNPKLGKSVGKYFQEGNSLPFLVNQVMINTPLTFEQRQELLETLKLDDRCVLLTNMLMREAQINSYRAEIAIKVKEKIEKNQKDYVLREQLEAIHEELGDKSRDNDIKEYEEALAKLKAPKEVKEKLAKEIKRLKAVMASPSESAVERTYIETLLELPWEKYSKERIDIDKAEEILEAEHFGLEKVKERVLEYLSLRALTKTNDAPIICFVGPPGTGKTSIAKSIAKSLNREYVRICLGGIRDEAEIRGHRKTYIGAMPGRIITGLKQAGVANPLMLLDEIDKVSQDYKGDTSSALLEVLDPEQNKHFLDHYIEVPVDLSRTLFIATANDVNGIPRPLLDRMELIEVSGYTANEKFHIGKEHLYEKQLMKNNLTKDQFAITDGALRDIISYYTREAGVRNLERTINKLSGKAAREILQKNVKGVKITSQNLEKYLGKRKYKVNPVNEEAQIGIVRGLAWTSVGGDTLEIEVNTMPGKGELILTGQLGDVMKESARIALTYVRSVAAEYKVSADFFEKNDIHIHIPEGAVPKDGPSAGITMSTALLSAVTRTPVKCNLAMTGEVTLRGRVLPIGGLKEKMLAAKMAGITNILVPDENEKDVNEIPKEIKQDMNIVYVESMSEVIKNAFEKKKRTSSK